MEKKYSIDEILQAVRDLENEKTKNTPKNQVSKKLVDRDGIPSYTLKLIEEAESKN